MGADSLAHVPIADLRAELGRRLPPTDEPLCEERYADLLAISYDLDLGDDIDQDIAGELRTLIVIAEIRTEHGDEARP